MRIHPTSGSGTVKCLLVDDLEENLLALSALLRADDVEVIQARSGPEALEALLAHDVALALLDVQMPDMDGFQLAELMRGSERTRDVPIIFVTAGARDQHRLFKGYESGAVDFLFKPVEPHILKSKADVFFQLHRQKRQLERELRERTETLRLNELFTAVLGHDLRGPLSAILMSAHLLQQRPDETGKRIGERLASSAKWMSRMIEDMLDLTRARLGDGIPLNCAMVDLRALFERVAQEQRDAYPERPVELRFEGNLMLYSDADRLTQVGANLIGNACKHGAATCAIEVVVSGTSAEEVVLTVSNEGHIPRDVLPHIFDPFRGRPADSRRTDGLGLGLFIVQQIVHSHEGRIDVESCPDGRTCFRVTLPRR